MTKLNANNIENINVVKDTIQIDDKRYYGKVLIKTKHPLNIKAISLLALKDKYTNLKSKSSIFIVDGIIINAESDKYFVDENSLLRILIDNVENSKENIDVGLIKILTKTEANINDLKKIRIRGIEKSSIK